jgi:hypothetical protein
MGELFWLLLTAGCVAWYAFLILSVGWKGWRDIRRMIAAIKARGED